jgi:outer membrane protein
MHALSSRKVMKIPLVLLSIALTTFASAQTKIALVRVKDVYLDLPSTQALQEKLLAERKAITENERAEQLRKSLFELDQLNQEIQSKLSQLESDAGKKLIDAFELKRQETTTLRTEFDNYKASEEKRINTEMVHATRSAMNKIMAAADQLAKERNFDAVFDLSANTNTGLPLLIYTSNTYDLTDDVIALLKETMPAEEKPTEEKPTENPRNP